MRFWQVDAFTSEMFCGNPAAVFILEQDLPEDLLQNVAMEMNLSETAFVIQEPQLKIRWFTPNCEVDLCGHATLAAAHVMWEQGLLDSDQVTFDSRSGPLGVKAGRGGYTLDFPLQAPVEKKEYLSLITEMLGVEPDYVGSNGGDCMAVVSDDSIVRSFVPDERIIGQLSERGFLLTARDQSSDNDYIYRAFFPKLQVPEDPVTGSANTCLAPYWSKVLKKNQLKASQVSKRGGKLEVEVSENRVHITGKAVTVLDGWMKMEHVFSVAEDFPSTNVD